MECHKHVTAPIAAADSRRAPGMAAGKREFTDFRRALRGFTLVELLVVLAIISLLAAMLLPALISALESARTVECANIEKQFAIAIFDFTDEHNGYLPCAAFSQKLPPYQTELFPDWQPGITIAFPYNNQDWDLRDLPSNVFWPYWQPLQKNPCPSHPSRKQLLEIIRTGNDSWVHSTSYLLPSHCLHMSGWSQYAQVKRTLYSRPHPSRLFMILEREDYPHQNSNNYGDVVFQPSWGTYGVKAMGYHHNRYKGFNACFFDGHVRFYHFDHQPVDREESELEVANWE